MDQLAGGCTRGCRGWTWWHAFRIPIRPQHFPDPTDLSAGRLAVRRLLQLLLFLSLLHCLSLSLSLSLSFPFQVVCLLSLSSSSPPVPSLSLPATGSQFLVCFFHPSILPSTAISRTTNLLLPLPQPTLTYFSSPFPLTSYPASHLRLHLHLHYLPFPFSSPTPRRSSAKSASQISTLHANCNSVDRPKSEKLLDSPHQGRLT